MPLTIISAKTNKNNEFLLFEKNEYQNEKVYYQDVDLEFLQSGAIITDEAGNDHLSMWGYNGSGELGTGNTTTQSQPITINLPETSIKTLSLGYNYSGTITTDEQGNDHLYMWGNNYFGQLGTGDNVNQLSPVEIRLPETWGYNRWGQHGDGTSISKKRPVQVSKNEEAQDLETLKINKINVKTNEVTLDFTLNYRDLNWVQVNQINSDNLTFEINGYPNIDYGWNGLNNENQLTGQLIISNLQNNNIYSDLTLKITHQLSDSSLTIEIPPFITLP